MFPNNIDVLNDNHLISFCSISFLLHSTNQWSLDNPVMNDKSIHPRFCELVDKIGLAEVERFYKYRAKGRSLPNIILRQQEQSKREQEGLPEKVLETNNFHDKNNTRRPRQRPTRRAASKSSKKSTILLPPSKKARTSPRSSTSPTRKLSGLSKAKRVMITSTMKESTRTLLQSSLARQPQKKRSHHMNQILLPPFILESQVDGSKSLMALRHLLPDDKVEIFNRKNGRILKGDDAVLLKDLPSVLRRHAEYEPVIPPPCKTM